MELCDIWKLFSFRKKTWILVDKKCWNNAKEFRYVDKTKTFLNTLKSY
jgi:hypothetical protein